MAEDLFKLFTSLRYDPAIRDVVRSQIQGAAGGWNSTHASPLYMLDYHRDRMLRAATYWGWDLAVVAIAGDVGLQRLEDFVVGLSALSHKPARVKVTLSREGDFGHEANEVASTTLSNLFPAALPPPESARGDDGNLVAGDQNTSSVTKEPVWEVVLDPERTPPSEYTHYKTTRRAMYDGARLRADIKLPGPRREVLLVNDQDGSIMEGSITTPYFWRGGRWVTPPVAPRFTTDVGSGGQDGTTRRWALHRGLCVEKPIMISSLTDGEECWISNGVMGFCFGKIVLAK